MFWGFILVLWLGFNLVPQRGDFEAVHLLPQVRLHPVPPTDQSGCWPEAVGSSGPLSRPAEVNWSPLCQFPARQSCRAIVSAHQYQILGVYQLQGGQTGGDEPTLSVNYLFVYIVLLLQKLSISVIKNINCFYFDDLVRLISVRIFNVNVPDV